MTILTFNERVVTRDRVDTLLGAEGLAELVIALDTTKLMHDLAQLARKIYNMYGKNDDRIMLEIVSPKDLKNYHIILTVPGAHTFYFRCGFGQVDIISHDYRFDNSKHVK